MNELLIFWAISLVLLLLILRSVGAGILSFSYFLILSLLHVPGAILYTVEGNILFDERTTFLGFELTLIGIFAFVLGLAVNLIYKKKDHFTVIAVFSDMRRNFLYLLILSLSSYFVFFPISKLVPSLTSIISQVNSLLAIAFWCWFIDAFYSRGYKQFILGIIMMLLIPIFTMMTSGFISYGVNWVIISLAIIVILNRKRLFWILGLFPIIAFIGLSFSVAYFSNRLALRDAVWYEQSSFSNRLGVIQNMVDSFEWLDLRNPDHIIPVNDRLNQNVLVGEAIQRMEVGFSEPANGATVPLWTFVPRIFWPDKPVVGGSGTIVSQYTGRIFGANTSVGVGQVLEFYINFGYVGVLLGFFFLGFVLMRMDIILMQKFHEFDLPGVVKLGLPGIALIQPGGSLIEILVGLIGALVAANLIAHFILRNRFLIERIVRWQSRKYVPF